MNGIALCRFLDPRPAEEAARRPIRDAVNIPLAELPQRTHELPARSATIRVAGPEPLATATVAWLRGSRRRAVRAADFAFDRAPNSRPTGRLWRPNDWLSEVLPRLKPGSGLDLACGTGRDAVYLAAAGWEVTAVDALPDALDRARDLASRYAPLCRSVRWLCLDLEGGAPEFDRRFDLITMFRYLHRPLCARLPRWLKPGASVLCETFTTVHRQRHGKPARDAHVLRPGELPGLFDSFEIRDYSEAWRGDKHTARIWAIFTPR